MENNEILQVCVDTVKGRADKFSAKQTSDEIINALVEMNHDTKLSARTFIPGNPVFELIQDLIPVIIEEGIKESTNPLFNYVDYRNLKNGDSQEFYVEGKPEFIVATTASGIRSVRRQRISGGNTIAIPTQMKMVRVYENLGRLMANRIDFNTFVDGVSSAYTNLITGEAIAELKGITTATAGLNSTYVKSGSLTETALLEMVDHVEAATGKRAAILGTRAAIRLKLGNAVTTSAEINTDLYNQGFVGRVSGVPTIGLPQAHDPGTDNFLLPNDALWIIASDDKFIKVVDEGEGLLIERDAADNADLTREYIYGQAMGVGTVCAAKLGYWYSII